MRTSPINRVIDHLRRAVLLPDGAGLGDGDLLGSFIERHDETALAALVRRHGPMVWGVCRRLLSHHDAEDAFQATFLVLVRKAASIRSREMVGNWLYGVAHQTALLAWRTAARRRAREVQVTEMPDIEAVRQDQWPELRPLLDEELSRLPEIYRAVIVLCELEGRSRKETARQLGVPEGTVGGRLARARVLLAKRLTQRGVVLSGGALAAILSQNLASAGVPALVVSKTIKVASLTAARQATADVISVKVAALTEGVLKTMFLSKLKSVVGTLMLVAVLVGGGVAISLGQPPDSPKPKKADPEPKQAKAKEDAANAKEDAADKKLEAIWAVVSVKDNDKNTLDSDPIFSHAAGTQTPVRNARLTLQAGKFTLKTGLVSLEGTYTFDPSVTPKKIILGITPDPGFLLSIAGVYSLEGDHLMVTFEGLPASQVAGLAGNKPGVCYTFKREPHPKKDADNPKKAMTTPPPRGNKK
jgi:RNA polymerase sigma factor (sigma-70 family)